jgi:hypothetical protein
MSRTGDDMATTYGSKYDGKLSTKEIAAKIRGDIKAAKAAGRIPAELKVSVRTDYYSMGCSIDLMVTRVPAGFRIKNPGYDARGPGGHSRPWLTREAFAVEQELEAIHQAYNHDGSDSMTDHYDVNYAGSVGWAWELTQAERLADEAAPAAA